jgi:hypothetical protein
MTRLLLDVWRSSEGEPEDDSRRKYFMKVCSPNHASILSAHALYGFSRCVWVVEYFMKDEFGSATSGGDSDGSQRATHIVFHLPVSTIRLLLWVQGRLKWVARQHQTVLSVLVHGIGFYCTSYIMGQVR